MFVNLDVGTWASLVLSFSKFQESQSANNHWSDEATYGRDCKFHPNIGTFIQYFDNFVLSMVYKDINGTIIYDNIILYYIIILRFHNVFFTPTKPRLGLILCTC